MIIASTPARRPALRWICAPVALLGLGYGLGPLGGVTDLGHPKRCPGIDSVPDRPDLLQRRVERVPWPIRRNPSGIGIDADAVHDVGQVRIGGVGSIKVRACEHPDAPARAGDRRRAEPARDHRELRLGAGDCVRGRLDHVGPKGRFVAVRPPERLQVRLVPDLDRDHSVAVATDRLPDHLTPLIQPRGVGGSLQAGAGKIPQTAACAGPRAQMGEFRNKRITLTSSGTAAISASSWPHCHWSFTGSISCQFTSSRRTFPPIPSRWR